MKTVPRSSPEENTLRGSDAEERDVRTIAHDVPEELVSFVMNSSNEGFWSFCPSTGDLYISPRCEELIGSTLESLPRVFKLADRLVHPKDIEPTRATFRHAIAHDDNPFDFAFRFWKATEERWRWFKCRCEVVARDDVGAPLRVLGTLRDITDFRQSNDSLGTSEDRYRQLVERQGEGIGIVDSKERFTFANPAGEEIFGVPPGELVGRSLREFVDDDEYDRVLGQTEQRRKGQTNTYELNIVRPDKGRRTILVTATPGVVGEKDYGGAFGIFRDITERKRAEGAVRESEERYRQLIDSLPHGVAIVTAREVKFVNRSALDIFGYRHIRELEGVKPLSLVAPGEGDHVFEQLSQMALGELVGPIHHFTRGLKTDGSEVPLEVFTTRVFFEGEPAFQIFMMDITERQDGERQQVLLEEQLRQALKMESIGRLAGGIAHDFNNMLAPILSLSQIALTEADADSTLSQDLRTITEAAERARDLTQQLLAFGRKQLLRMRVLDFNAIITNAHDFLRRLIREDIEIELQLEPELGAIRADDAQLHQILMNLSHNASDAMPDGGTVTIRTRNAELDVAEASLLAELEAGAYVILEVHDTGSGMDEETRDHVFEPFFSTKGKGQGTGLGLATVHGIVKQHDGHIMVETAPGTGSTFTIYLPQVLDVATEGPKTPRPMDTSHHHATILVAEDDGAVRRSACRILQSRGFRVIQARDGEEALVLARRHKGSVDVVLTDVIMPRLNGQELCQRLASLSPGTAVVFMSGYARDVIAKTGVLEEGTLFVQKPFSVRSLMDKIEEALAATRKL